MLIWILWHELISGYEDEALYAKEYRADFFAGKWITLISVNIMDFDFQKSIFTRYKKQETNNFTVVEESIMPDIVWVRTSRQFERSTLVLHACTHLFPSKLVTCIANNKRATYRAFPFLQPKTHLLSHVQNRLDLIDDWGDEVIIKKCTWYGGEGVYKVLREEVGTIIHELEADQYVVQELCDFSQGYPWLCNGNHDLRLTFIGGEFAYSELRYNENDFRVNVSLWWGCRNVEYNEIPQDIHNMSNKILDKLWWEETWVISMDFGYDVLSNNWRLIEFNDSPGFTNKEFESDTKVIDIAFAWYAKAFLNIQKELT